jgi:agmatine deiminase
MTTGGADNVPGHHVSRRAVLAGGLLLTSGVLDAGGAAATGHRPDGKTPAAAGWFAPAEGLPHTRTWMAWPARKDVWGAALPHVRHDVAAVARAIARYEPVVLVARPEQASEAARACGKGVDVVEIVNDDLWMRDMGPVFLVNDRGGLAGLDMNFNGWGNKQVHHNDHKIAREILAMLGVHRFVAPFVAEGGALEFNGAGTVMATESSIINSNRNPGKSKATLTREICGHLGAKKMLWVPGLKGHDITDDHIDGLARWVGAADVVVDQPADPHANDVWAVSERRALEILKRSTNAADRRLNCGISRESARIPPHENPNLFVNVYINWYLCNGAVMMPKFDDEAADDAARSLVRKLYPDRDVVQLRIDSLAEGGGGIHCVTQQQPKAAMKAG